MPNPVNKAFEGCTVIRLEELVRFRRGENITAAEMNPGDIPVVSAGLDFSGFHNKCNVKGPSITISSSGANAGKILYHNYNFWAADCLFAEWSRNMLFSAYFLKYLQPIISNLQRGSAQPHVYSKNVNHLTVCVPKQTLQTPISMFLEKYDLLIESNSKRINLLESIAMQLYKEWFVRFRFPGYKKEKFENGRPKGWVYGKIDRKKPVSFEFKDLKAVAEFKRGKNITSDEMVEGLVPVVSAGLQPSGYHNESNVEGYSLTVSASGANAGYLLYHLEDIWAADCSYCQSDCLWFVYNAMKFLQPVISNMQCGSAQPHVYPKHLNRLSIALPKDLKLVKKYNDLVSPIYEEIKNLLKQNENLEKQRDSLLPRLMSGKLSVEGKEIV